MLTRNNYINECGVRCSFSYDANYLAVRASYSREIQVPVLKGITVSAPPVSVPRVYSATQSPLSAAEVHWHSAQKRRCIHSSQAAKSQTASITSSSISQGSGFPCASTALTAIPQPSFTFVASRWHFKATCQKIHAMKFPHRRSE